VSARFLPAGDVALVVELDEEVSEGLAARLRALEWLLSDGRLPGVIETVPSFRSLLVYYDPEQVGFEALRRAIEERLRQCRQSEPPRARRLEIPCCYTPDLGFELEAAARRIGMAPQSLIEAHAGAEYLVYFIGFAPGQPYLTGLPAELTIPRLDSPRTSTPPGSVGIGGNQCCIYSVESPGGFWVLGRTPLPLYAPQADAPVLLEPGDRIRFRPIDRAEFDRIETEVANGRYAPRIA
jgi:KipI family sensor histidine kinase inhibitor